MTYSFTSRLAGLLCCICLSSASGASLDPVSNGFLLRNKPDRTVVHPPNANGSDVCPRPELLQVDLVTDSTARLTWSDVGDKYEVELVSGTDAFTGMPTYVVNADPPFDVTGLTPGRNYRFQVRTVCNDTSSSVWSTPRSFITDLNNDRPCPLNLDLRDTSCNNIQVFNLYVDHAPGTALGTDVQLHGVRMMVEHAWRSDLSIWLRAPNGNRIQLIGDLNAGDKNIGDPAGAVCPQFVELTDDPAVAKALSTAAEKDNITGYYLPVQALSGLHDGQDPVGIWQVEICDSKADHKGKLRLFELVFSRVDCATFFNVTAGNVTENSADISWLMDMDGDSLLIEYGPAGFLPGAEGLAGNGGTAIRLQQPVTGPYMLNGLQTLQAYDVYLRRLCAPGIWSANSYKASFFTNCPPTLLETLETLPLCPTDCPDPCPLPGTWQNAPDDDYEWKVYTGPGLIYPVAGPAAAPGGSGNYLYFRNSCSPTGAFGKTAILRTLCIQVVAPPAQACHFSFDLYMNTKIGQMSTLALQVSTDGGQTWAPLQSWSGNRGKLWRREYVNLSAYDGQIALFQFVATGTFGAYGDIAMDNLAFYGSQAAGTPDYIFYRDADNDNFGNPDVRVISCFPVAPPGYRDTDGDCNDNNPNIYPGAPEILCNQIDENCNGMADDSAIPTPAAPADVEICKGSPATLSASGAPLGQYYWFDQAAGGQPIATGNLLTLSNPAASHTYYLLDSITGPGGGCASARVPVLLTVHPKPFLTLATSPSICDGSPLDLSALPVQDTANAGGVLSYHSATPPAPGNQLPSPVVHPGFSTTYYILSTTTFGCKGSKSVNVSVLPSPEVQIAPGDSINVCRGKTVQLMAQESGVGIPPITYAWSNGLNFANIPVQAGNAPDVTNTYTVTVSDANGCTGTDQIQVHTLNNVTQTAIEAVQNVSTCGGSDGSITLHPLNGTPPYNFAWSGGGSLTGVTGTGTITGLAQGSYRVTVTDATSGGCSMVMPQIVLNAPGLDVSLDTIIHPACPDALTGSIVLNATGQNPMIEWSNQQSGSTASFLGAGIYSATITDGNCSQVLSNLEVVSPPPIEIILNALQQVACFGDSTGAIDLAVFGATPPYTFQWSNSAGTEDLTDLPKGSYQCTITDANNCAFVAPSYTINEPQLLTVQPDSQTNVRCYGEKSGFLRIKAAGGAPPYQYLWNTGATTASLGNVVAGIYAVTVTDANGCTANWLGVISQPSSLQIEFTLKTNPTCIGAKDGNIELILSGGQPPFQFHWNNNGNTAKIENLGVGQYQASITDIKGCTLVTPAITLTAPQLLTVSLDSLHPVGCRGDHTGLIAVSVGGAVGSVSATWNGVPDDLIWSNAAAGNYILQVMDTRGCTIKDTFNIPEPESALNLVVLEIKDALCAGEPTGSIYVRINGGTQPYKFSWSNGASTLNLPAVPAGTYSLTATDANGCTAVLPAVVVGEPPALVATATVHDIPCFGVLTGDIQLTVSGGLPSYRYYWNTADTSQNLFNLAAGSYSVTVLDATGCAQVLTDLTVIDQAVNFVLESLRLQPVSCSGAADGSITAQVTNGTPPYQFSWSPPIGLHSNIMAPRDTVSGLSGGEYWVTVTDAAGCTAISQVISIEEAPPLLLNINSISNIICKGDSTGSIKADVSGGVPPYQYMWNNGADQADIDQLPAGSYQLTVTDVRGCTLVSVPAIVHEPAAALNIVLDQLTPDKCGKNQGAVQLHVTGGVPPNTYLWDNGATTASLAKLAPGTYQLTVTDFLGCTEVSPVYEVVLLAPPLVLASSDIHPVLCYGDSTGMIVPAVTGGTPGYQYAWSNGSTSPALTAVPAGNYTLTVSDAGGCFAFYMFTVGQPASPLQATWMTDSLPGGWAITLTPSGGTASYDIQWDAQTGNQTGPTASGLAPGLYQVTVTDMNDCALILQIPAGNFTGVQQTEAIRYMVLAPNPAAGYSRLLVELRSPEALRMQLFSGTGQLLSAWESPEKADRYAIPIDISRWPPGLYWVMVRLSNGEGKTLRLIHTGSP